MFVPLRHEAGYLPPPFAGDARPAPRMPCPVRPPSRAIRRFDSVGSVRFIVNDVKAHLAAVFGKEAKDLVRPLTALVRRFAPENRGLTVVLSLSCGMARRELDEFTRHASRHNGPVVIDPDIRTRDFEVFADWSKIGEEKKKFLIRENNASGGIMAVIFAIDNFQHPYDGIRLTATRIRLATATLEELDAEMKDRETYGHFVAQFYELRRRLVALYSHLLGRVEHVRGGDDPRIERFLAQRAGGKSGGEAEEAEEAAADGPDARAPLPGAPVAAPPPRAVPEGGLRRRMEKLKAKILGVISGLEGGKRRRAPKPGMLFEEVPEVTKAAYRAIVFLKDEPEAERTLRNIIRQVEEIPRAFPELGRLAPHEAPRLYAAMQIPRPVPVAAAGLHAAPPVTSRVPAVPAPAPPVAPPPVGALAEEARVFPPFVIRGAPAADPAAGAEAGVQPEIFPAEERPDLPEPQEPAAGETEAVEEKPETPVEEAELKEAPEDDGGEREGIEAEEPCPVREAEMEGPEQETSAEPVEPSGGRTLVEKPGLEETPEAGPEHMPSVPETAHVESMRPKEGLAGEGRAGPRLLVPAMRPKEAMMKPAIKPAAGFAPPVAGETRMPPKVLPLMEKNLGLVERRAGEQLRHVTGKKRLDSHPHAPRTAPTRVHAAEIEDIPA